MPLTAAIALASAAVLGQEWTRTEISSPLTGGCSLILRTIPSGLNPAKTSPKNLWSFDSLTYVAVKEHAEEYDRFRVFGQSSLPKDPCPTPAAAARLLARLYDFNSTVLRLEHFYEFGNGRIDVYLCGEGKAGGEQTFGEDPYTPNAAGGPTKVNTVYIYDVWVPYQPTANESDMEGTLNRFATTLDRQIKSVRAP